MSKLSSKTYDELGDMLRARKVKRAKVWAQIDQIAVFGDNSHDIERARDKRDALNREISEIEVEMAQRRSAWSSAS